VPNSGLEAALKENAMPRLDSELNRSQTVGQWQLEPEFRDATKIDGLTIFLSGVEAHHKDFGSVSGSAAGTETHPIDRAWYELVERISILQNVKAGVSTYPLLNADGTKTGRLIDREAVFPSALSNEYQFSKSNGAALHSTWAEACRRATLELIERHLVLSSWVGRLRPLQVVENSSPDLLRPLARSYEVKKVHLGAQRVSCMASSISASVVALIPRDKNLPLILGFGAEETSEKSLRKAEEEALQRLGFLWGEELSDEAPEFSPTNLYHQDYHLMREQREKIQDWLSGAFYREPGPKNANHNTLDRMLNIDFVDLTAFPELELKVARAICPEAIPLVFGRWRSREFADLPDSLLIHPVA
jgi:ribosomal protein S12 methylthiotransferase accessory factor YcaO